MKEICHFSPSAIFLYFYRIMCRIQLLRKIIIGHFSWLFLLAKLDKISISFVRCHVSLKANIVRKENIMNCPYQLSIDPVPTTSLPKPEKVPPHQRSGSKNKAILQAKSKFFVGNKHLMPKPNLYLYSIHFLLVTQCKL